MVLAEARAGRSGVLVVRGVAGVGKSALLGYVATRVEGWHVATAAGVESEMELAYCGLHQLCGPMLEHVERLPVPQRDALTTVFGLSAGDAPDRFLAGLATLTLFADVAERQPLVCIVDDAQWLDHASAQILGFVARRLLAERIAVIAAARRGSGDGVLTELPELGLQGLADGDARALLMDNLHGPLDTAVCDQIVAESHGNPLALFELPRTWDPSALAGGFGLPGSQAVEGRIEQSYAQRIVQLPAVTQLLVLAAAAEPIGDPVLLHRAADSLGIPMAASRPAGRRRSPEDRRSRRVHASAGAIGRRSIGAGRGPPPRALGPRRRHGRGDRSRPAGLASRPRHAADQRRGGGRAGALRRPGPGARWGRRRRVPPAAPWPSPTIPPGAATGRRRPPSPASRPGPSTRK